MLRSKSVWGEKKARGEGKRERERGEKARDIRSFLRQRKERHPQEPENSHECSHHPDFVLHLAEANNRL